MGYISALTKASVFAKQRMFAGDLKVIAKDTNNISNTVRYGLGMKTKSESYLPWMQIFVI